MDQIRVLALIIAPSCLRRASYTIRVHLNMLFLLVLLGAAGAADAQVQPQAAQRWFEEATKLCERDAGRLWGVSLSGPIVSLTKRPVRVPQARRNPRGRRVVAQRLPTAS